MVVEFSGMYCVGKTTVARLLTEQLQHAGVVAKPLQIKQIPWSSRLSLPLLIAVIRLYLFIQPNLKKQKLGRFLTIYSFLVKYKYAKNKSQLWVLDQGAIQSIGALKKFSKNPQALVLSHRIMNNIKLPDVLIRVSASYQKVRTRRKQRENIGFSERSFERMTKSASVLSEDLKRVNATEERIKVFHVYNNTPEETQKHIKKIVDYIVCKQRKQKK